jgi:hypothetical protein
LHPVDLIEQDHDPFRNAAQHLSEIDYFLPLRKVNRRAARLLRMAAEKDIE